MTKKSQTIIFSLISFFLPLTILGGLFYFTELDYVKIKLFLLSLLGGSFVAEAINIWIFDYMLTAREKRVGLVSFVSGLSLAITIYTLFYLFLWSLSGAIMDN